MVIAASKRSMPMKASLLQLVLVMTLGVIACDGNDGSASARSELQARPTTQPENNMKIRLTLQDKTLTATLQDTPTTRDFVALLPLTLTMKDLFGREKYAQLPRAISERGTRQFSYEVGQIIYWSPGPDVAIYYKDDGEKIPQPGIIVIGKLDSGVEAFKLPGALKVTIERATG
jgi:hypothetical protein